MMLSLWSSLDKFHWFNSISRWYLPAAPWNAQLAVTFRWTSLWHFGRHTLQSASICSPLERKFTTARAYFKKFSTGAKACTHETVSPCFVGTTFSQNHIFRPFPVFLWPHQIPLQRLQFLQSLQTRDFKQCFQYEIMLPTSSLRRLWRVQPMIWTEWNFSAAARKPQLAEGSTFQEFGLGKKEEDCF